jgi:gliding motility-associated-like protein
MNKQLKDYTAQPDPEVWNRIENTLHRRALLRRWTRIGAGAAAAAIVAAIVLIPAGKPASSPAMPVIVTPGTTQIAQANIETAVDQSNTLEPSNLQTLKPSSNQAIKQSSNRAIPTSDITIENGELRMENYQSAAANSQLSSNQAIKQSSNPNSQTLEPSNLQTLKPSNLQESRMENYQSAAANPQLSTFNSQLSSNPVAQDLTDVATEPQQPVQKAATSGQDDTILWIPNAFAPASDDASITIFRPRLSRPGETLTDYRLAIFNRRGMQVFHTNSLDQGWNGTYNGRPLPQGAYVYVIYYTDKDHIRHQRKGTVTLIR